MIWKFLNTSSNVAVSEFVWPSQWNLLWWKAATLGEEAAWEDKSSSILSLVAVVRLCKVNFIIIQFYYKLKGTMNFLAIFKNSLI